MMTPRFFMVTMRTYLTTYPIGGHSWKGVSAANLASQMQLDYLVGTVDAAYAKHVSPRLSYLPDEHAVDLRRDIAAGSITDLLLDELALHGFATGTDRGRAAAPRLPGACLGQVLAAYRKFIKAYGSLSSLHWALIKAYMIKPKWTADDGAGQKLAVNPHRGSSGMSMSDVESIRGMRRRHPVVGRVLDCAEVK